MESLSFPTSRFGWEESAFHRPALRFLGHENWEQELGCVFLWVEEKAGLRCSKDDLGSFFAEHRYFVKPFFRSIACNKFYTRVWVEIDKSLANADTSASHLSSVVEVGFGIFEDEVTCIPVLWVRLKLNLRHNSPQQPFQVENVLEPVQNFN